MKIEQIVLHAGYASSFQIRKELKANINNRWHCHKELELIHFHQGSGTQFIGDHIQRFKPGDIVLVGSNLPHYWRYDLEYDESNEQPYSTVIHFHENFLGTGWLDLPEFYLFKNLFEVAQRGIILKGSEHAVIVNLIETTYQSTGFNRLMCLLTCLDYIANIHDPHVLASVGFSYKYSENETNRLNNIYNYTLKNFKNKIELDQVASIADLVPSSFCRYFKNRTGKTYTQFLQEVRVGYACKLLVEDKGTIKQICYDSGFSNYTSFHEIFKTVTGKTPKAYLKSYLTR
ncbi:helix-turn-helix domain-containing protein [Olivibacter sp. CPCC 100613]|uniref:AraC family transcriptional regulator n=1 Tax=Olivibacter sp. CPCC 100613 TaxID=3079931 RepID=UPI002FF6D202